MMKCQLLLKYAFHQLFLVAQVFIFMFHVVYSSIMETLIDYAKALMCLGLFLRF